MSLHELLAKDHERLDALLRRCVDSRAADMPAYVEFRGGLLRHIAIEERLLFPLMRARGAAADLVDQLHRDHAALSALLVPPPAAGDLTTIAAILTEHNPLEEGRSGMYEIAESIAGDAARELIAKVQSFPDVRVAAHVDTAITRAAIDQLLRAAAEGRQRFVKR